MFHSHWRAAQHWDPLLIEITHNVAVYCFICIGLAIQWGCPMMCFKLSRRTILFSRFGSNIEKFLSLLDLNTWIKLNDTHITTPLSQQMTLLTLNHKLMSKIDQQSQSSTRMKNRIYWINSQWDATGRNVAALINWFNNNLNDLCLFYMLMIIKN